MQLPQKQHVQIVFYRTKALLLSEESRTYLGFLWWIVEPLLELGIYYVVFGLILQRGGPDFTLQLLSGILVFRLFANSTSSAPELLIHNEHVIQAVPLPKYIFPAANTVVHSFKFLFLLAIMLIFLFLSGVSFTPYMLIIIPLTLLYIAFCLGASMLLAGFTPFVPDFARLYPKISMLLFWGSGVFYRPEEYLSASWLPYFYANPVAGFISTYRDCLLFGRVNVELLTYLTIFSSLLLILGYGLLSRFDKRYPRILAQQ